MKDIKFNTMDFNYQQYHEFGERLTLPYGIKAMLEPGCHEYNQLPMEKRAIHLAYVLYHGFDLVEEIRERVRDYAPYSREYQYKNGMAATIMYLRTGKAWSFLFDEDRVKLEDVVRAAGYLLRPGGTFSMVHKPFRIPEILELMRLNRLEPKRMQLVQPNEKGEANMVLIEGIKSGKSGMKILRTINVYNMDGSHIDYNEL